MDVEHEELTSESPSSDSSRFLEGCAASSFSLSVLRLAVLGLPKKREQVMNEVDEVNSSLGVL